MLRRPLLVANWKMYKTVPESLAFGRELLRRLEGLVDVARHRELVICPTLPALWGLSRLVASWGIGVGAQNLDLGREGALTGAVSGYLLAEAGATYVIVGHSERRRHFGETDELVARKAVAALEARLAPIVCVGETLEERDRGDSADVVARQVAAVLEAVPKPPAEAGSGLVVAYEPVWAIGTGKVPTPEEAGRMAAGIRRQLVDAWGDEGRAVRLLYGGSVNAGNIAGFWDQEEIDGALVGGASLDVTEFLRMATVRLAGEEAVADGG